MTEASNSTAHSRRGFMAATTIGGVTAAGMLAGGRPAAAAPPPHFARTSSEAVNVKDHGATGSGRTDDSRAVQAAVDEAVKTRRAVFFPSGTYRVEKTLKASGPLYLLGAGSWLTTVLCTSDNSFFGPATGSDSLVVEDLAFDSDGHQRAVFEIDGSSVHDFVFRRCRFTNMAGPIAAPAAVELLNVGTGLFTDCLWHNPAKYAGFGTGVRAQHGTSGGRITLNGRNRFLWLNNGFRSEPYSSSGAPKAALTETSLEAVVVDGAYFDAF